MDAVKLIAQLATTARKAARTLNIATAQERSAALGTIAEELEKESAQILAAIYNLTTEALNSKVLRI